MKKYKYKDAIKIFNFVRVLSIVFSIVSMIFIQVAFGLFILLLTIGSYFITTGFEINTSKNKYRYAISIFGLFIGIWKKLPQVEYVSIVGIHTTGRVIPGRMLEQGMGVVDYNINLIVDDNIRYINIITLEKEEALKVGLDIGETLDLKVLDYTSSDEKWIR